MLSNSMVDGKLWTLPVEAFKCFTLYNKSIFDQFGLTPPTNYEELKAVAAVLNENGIVPLDTGSKGGNPGHLLFNALVDQFEGGKADVAAVATSFNVDTPAFNSAAAAVEQMVKDGIVPSDTIANGDWGPSIVLYNEGKAGMLFSCPWMLGQIKPEIAEVSEPMALPALDGSTVDPNTFNVGGVTMGIVAKKDSFEDPAKQAALVDFVDFLAADEMFTALGTASMMPAKNVPLDPTVLSPLFVKIVDFSSLQDTNDVLWSVLPSSAAQEAYSSAMDELFAGAPASEAIGKIQESVAAEKP
jgi:ABC-type glycerol-3-phosphate transport system substrate-binding protein